jgi:hypothetical protein
VVEFLSLSLSLSLYIYIYIYIYVYEGKFVPVPVTVAAQFMYVCIRGGLLQPLHLDPQWSIVLNPYDR